MDDIIEKIEKVQNFKELLIILKEYYPNGFDINKINSKIKKKIDYFEEEYKKYNGTLEEISRLN